MFHSNGCQHHESRVRCLGRQHAAPPTTTRHHRPWRPSWNQGIQTTSFPTTSNRTQHTPSTTTPPPRPSSLMVVASVPASQALLESQRGPHASRPFTTIPYHADTTYESHLFRILLLRRLRLPIPLTASHCRCRRALDPYGDHRAACAQSGILRNRAGPLERATARMCREAGARVTTNTLLTNLNIEHSTRPDDRRIEVIANGLTLWGGTQLAIDTTLVSPLTRDGQPRRRAGRFTGAALQDARRRKERTYPELIGGRRCRLVVLGIETGGRWSEEASMFVKLLAQAKARQAPPLLQTSLAPPSSPDGPLRSAMPPCTPSRPACSPKIAQTTPTWRETSPPSARCSPKHPSTPPLPAAFQPAPKEPRQPGD